MKRLIVVACSVSALTGCAGGEPAAELKPYNSSLGFKVMIPEPHEDTGAYIPPLRETSVTFKSDEGSLRAGCSEFTDDQEGLAARQKLSSGPIAALDEASCRLVDSVHGKVSYQAPVKLHQRYDGRDIEGSTPEGRFHMRIFLVDGRFYQVCATGDAGFISSNRSYNFLNSLEVN